jgi:type 1 glutamine amidotransferase
MKTLSHFSTFGVLALATGLLLGPRSAAAQAAASGKIRVLVVVGGHDFETNQFHQMFRDNPDVSHRAVTHPNAHALWKADAAKEWDVMVCYDMWQDIAEEAQADLLARLKEGKGLVSLHHSLANYQKWPAYEKIIGGHYNLEKRTVNGVERPRSTYKHDVQFKVQVVNKQHPITRGLEDFEIHDETYGLFDVSAGVDVLLKTQEPTSGPIIAWAKTCEAARVVYLQLGHDHLAYENPNYRKLLAQAIRWAAKRD